LTKKHLSLLVVFVMLFTSLFSSFAFAAEEEMVLADDITINVDYHVQSYGDRKASGDGAVFFGTEGESKRLEKFKITLEGAPADMELVANGHVQTYGDMPEDGSFTTDAIGTTAEAKRLEGLGLKLVKKGTDELYPGYSIQYQVHMRWYGWGANADQNWRKGNADAFAADGEYAGTKGEGLRLEGVSIRILKEAKLAVKDVSADNLKQVVVEFNQAVDADTIVDANFTLKKGNVTVPVSAVADESGKAAILTVEPADPTKGLDNQGKYTLTVEKVKNLSGKAIEKTSVDFTAFDAELPEVLSVDFTGPRSFVVKFSEPIKDKGTVTVKTDKSTLSVNQNVTGLGTDEIAVNTYSTLSDGVEYTITVKDFADYAGYKNIILSEGFTYYKDTTPPVASIEKAEQEYVVVNFNKPVKGLTKDHFYHTFTAWTAIKLTATNDYEAPALKATDSVSKVYVWFNAAGNDDSRPLPDGEVDLVIKGKVGSVEIKDNWDNKFATTSFVLNVNADNTIPEVKEIKVTAETALTIEFTKNVTFKKDNIEILDEDGDKIDGLSLTVTGSGKKYTVDFGKNLAGETIIVNIKDVEDTSLRANVLKSYTEVIDVTDKTAPKASEITLEKTTKDGEVTGGDLYVFFNEEVDPDTALVAGNYYYVNGTTYVKLTEGPSFYTSNSIVRIPLTKDQAKNITANLTQLFVTSVKDLAGNAIAPGLNDIKEQNTNFPYITKAEAVAKNKIEATFNQEIKPVDLTDFVVKAGETELDVTEFEVTLDKGKTKVIFTLKNNLASDAKSEGVDVNVEIAKKENIENLFGVSATGNPADKLTKTVADKIAPAIAKIGDTDVDDVTVTSATSIEIVFEEDIDDNTISALTFEVDGFTVKSAKAEGKKVTLTLNLKTKQENGDTITVIPAKDTKVTQKYPLKDVSGNSVKDLTTKVSNEYGI
jgi:hypothetical protein